MDSLFAACCYVPCFALRCEETRHPEYPPTVSTALLDPHDPRRVWQVSCAARRAGIRPGITVSQAIGLSPTIQLYQPDPVYYEARFTELLDHLSTISPVIEPAELGRVYVGTDGLERIYGGVEEVIERIQLPKPQSAIRVGWGRGKFVSWVAAARAGPGQSVLVRPGEEVRFLASQPVAVLPLDADVHTRLRQLGLHSLRDLTALPEDALAAQFGVAGRRLWQLAAGKLSEPVKGRETPEPITVSLTFYSPVADRQLLLQSLDALIDRALRHPRRAGWRVQRVRVRAELEYRSSWMIDALLKEPAADRRRILAPLKIRLERSPPLKAVERLMLEFTSFVPGTDELQLFARDAGAAARAGRRRALRNASREIALRLNQPMLYHVISVQPWSRIPERRYGLTEKEQ
ncbi:MAG TPA: hypothetical protein VLV45_12690 [Gemmatimonadales bacterium]|nr:hypothetical protein [Gemmatimonadales bacterium]